MDFVHISNVHEECTKSYSSSPITTSTKMFSSNDKLEWISSFSSNVWVHEDDGYFMGKRPNEFCLPPVQCCQATFFFFFSSIMGLIWKWPCLIVIDKIVSNTSCQPWVSWSIAFLCYILFHLTFYYSFTYC